MDETLRTAAWERANHVCEYCQMPQAFYRVRFACDHVIARQHGGETVADNLALACHYCNRHKGPNIAGIDPLTGEFTRLFHPRRDVWTEHFAWAGAELTGLSTIGRATIGVLAINDPLYIKVRESLIAEGQFPVSRPSSPPPPPS